jgi:hypothetical protein
MASRRDHFGAKLLPLIEHVAPVAAVGAGVILIRLLVAPIRSTLQLVLVIAAAMVASYSVFFFCASFRRFRMLRRLLHEGGAAEKPEPYRH